MNGNLPYILIPVVTLTAIALAVVLALRKKGKRGKALQEFAKMHSYEFIGSVKHTLGRIAKVGDHGGKTAVAFETTVTVLKSEGISALPSFDVSAAKDDDSEAERYIEFASHPEFSDRYSVFAYDEDGVSAIRRVFSPQLLDFLMKTDSLFVQCRKDGLMIRIPKGGLMTVNTLWRVEAMEDNIKTTRRLAELLLARQIEAKTLTGRHPAYLRKSQAAGRIYQKSTHTYLLLRTKLQPVAALLFVVIHPVLVFAACKRKETQPHILITGKEQMTLKSFETIHRLVTVQNSQIYIDAGQDIFDNFHYSKENAPR